METTCCAYNVLGQSTYLRNGRVAPSKQQGRRSGAGKGASIEGVVGHVQPGTGEEGKERGWSVRLLRARMTAPGGDLRLDLLLV